MNNIRVEKDNKTKFLSIINIIGVILIWIGLWYLADVLYVSSNKLQQIVANIIILIIGIILVKKTFKNEIQIIN